LAKWQPQRLVIIGAAGSGKTTLAKQLSAKLNLPHFELDDLAWNPGWEMVDDTEFSRRIELLINVNPKQWVICGNYAQFQHLFWPQADTFVWLDPPLWLSVWRTLKRGISEMRTKKLICGQNRQTWWRLLFSPNALIPWILRTYRRRKARNHAAMNDPQWADKQWFHLQNKQDINEFLALLN
jgi:adenylate kinase family enzyme